jgi:hypothetical protein
MYYPNQQTSLSPQVLPPGFQITYIERTRRKSLNEGPSQDTSEEESGGEESHHRGTDRGHARLSPRLQNTIPNINHITEQPTNTSHKVLEKSSIGMLPWNDPTKPSPLVL